MEESTRYSVPGLLCSARERNLSMWHPQLPSTHVFTHKGQSIWFGVTRSSDSTIVPVVRDFKILHYSRERGAIGVPDSYVSVRRAASFDVAQRMLWDEYEPMGCAEEVSFTVHDIQERKEV